jgi:hypothetical protein
MTIKDNPIMPAVDRRKFSHVSAMALRRLTVVSFSTVGDSTAIVFLRFPLLEWLFYSLITAHYLLLSAPGPSANGD